VRESSTADRRCADYAACPVRRRTSDAATTPAVFFGPGRYRWDAAAESHVPSVIQHDDRPGSPATRAAPMRREQLLSARPAELPTTAGSKSTARPRWDVLHPPWRGRIRSFDLRVPDFPIPEARADVVDGASVKVGRAGMANPSTRVGLLCKIGTRDENGGQSTIWARSTDIKLITRESWLDRAS
jgi:hypothetical protein